MSVAQLYILRPFVVNHRFVVVFGSILPVLVFHVDELFLEDCAEHVVF